MKDLISLRTAAANPSCHQNTPQEEYNFSPEDFLPGEYGYTGARQVLYSYWWWFWHICLRCIRRVRLTPATTDTYGFHPNMIPPNQLGGNVSEDFLIQTFNHIC